MEDSFKNNNNLVMVSISVDNSKERWLNSVAAETYTTPGSLNLYTGGRGVEDPMIKYYRFTAFPRLMIIDRNGNLFDAKAPTPSSPSGFMALVSKIKDAMKMNGNK
jgi:hypothetical protein